MLQFEESFFEGETRNDFYIEPMMKRCWAASLEVLAEIDRICKKHGIRYFADWGTLLGAVRHKGFIPWDDDIDITMLRPDYQKFMQIAPGEFKEPFELISIHTDKEWNNMLFRVPSIFPNAIFHIYRIGVNKTRKGHIEVSLRLV